MQRRRRPRPHADEPVEVLVERRLEVVGVLARVPALLDPSLQLGDHRVEIDSVVRGGRVSRIRRHGVNLAEDVRRDGPALACRSHPPRRWTMANDRLSEHRSARSRRRSATRRRARRDRGGGARAPRRGPTSRASTSTGCASRRRGSRCAPPRPTTSGPRSRCSRSRPTCRRSRPIDVAQPRRRRREEGRAQGRVLHGATTSPSRCARWAGRRRRSANAAAERIEQLEARVRELEARLARLESTARGPSES